MSLKVQHIVIHSLTKDAESVKVTPRASMLDVTPVSESFVEDIHNVYNAKAGKTYGFFREDSEFLKVLNEWRAESESFLNLSIESANLLAAEISKYDFAEDGYLFFADYEFVGTRYLLIGLFGLQPHFSVDSSLALATDSHLDLGKVQLAARIDLTEMNVDADSKRAISFIKGRAGRKVADFFLDFMGCEEGVVAKEQTQQVVQAVEEYMASEQLNAEEKQDVRKSLVEYCNQQKTLGNDGNIAEISEVVSGASESQFADFYQQQDYEVEESFPLEAAVANKMLKFSGYGGGVAINFERKHLGSTVVYDPVHETLLIKKVPGNLKSQLMEQMKQNSKPEGLGEEE